MEGKIVTIENRKDEKFLRQKTHEFDFEKFSRQEVNALVMRMKKAMNLANGIGLSANQIGLDMRVFVAQIPKEDRRGNPRSQSSGEQKFYAVFNPELKKFSKEKATIEEGCLSVPGIYGRVERPEKLIMEGFDKNGKKIKIKAWGLLARVFQHEVDHLNGKIFIDRADKIYQIPSSERLKERLKTADIPSGK
ncbi:MAG: peptide deformylase [Candidatus Liptonbacteria bacterium]|nr:peptide deformylase [Candidatus Liptonbacteria bacterium]